ncbi:MAG: flagellar hook-length control protein FliK [Actinobacteria bacterium]|nr:flagellar hook-length control protein FliK [Actinomycetota bacterium]
MPANSTTNSGLVTGQYGTAGHEGAGTGGSGSQSTAAGGAGSGWAGTSGGLSRSHLSNTSGPGGAEQGGVQSTAAALDALLSSLAESSGYIGDAVVTVSPGATPAQVAAEIVDVLIPLQSSGEGVGSVTIRLEPPGLGAIRAMVQASASGLTVHFQTDNARAHELLAQLLQDIKEHLASGSFRSTTVTLSWGGATGQGTGQGTGHGTGQGASRISTGASTEAGANDMLVGAQAVNPAGGGTRGKARLVDLRI